MKNDKLGKKYIPICPKCGSKYVYPDMSIPGNVAIGIFSKNWYKES